MKLKVFPFELANFKVYFILELLSTVNSFAGNLFAEFA